MREYELTVIYRTTENHPAGGKEAVGELLKKQGFTTKKQEEAGARDLAYPIKKETRGHYQLLVIEGEQTNLPEIEKEMRLNESILKYLFVKTA